MPIRVLDEVVAKPGVGLGHNNLAHGAPGFDKPVSFK
jgi:hypothetical protein